MLGRIFGREKTSAETPQGVRLYAVGDIHGCLDKLDALLAMIEADQALEPTATSRLIFLGDYIDRGPDSRGVIERMTEIERRDPEAVFLKGNHEAAFLDFLADPLGNEEWLDWGGAEMLASYGVEKPYARNPVELAADWRAAAAPSHLAFMHRLQRHFRIGDFLFVHAGIRPGVALEDQSDKDLFWIRSEFHDMDAALRPTQVVVHGHQPTRKPVDAGWRIGVDTGACWSGKLTAVVLDGSSRRFLSTG